MTETDDLVARLRRDLDGSMVDKVDVLGICETVAWQATRLEAQSRALTASQEAIDNLRDANERLRKALEEAEDVFSLSEIPAFPDPAWHDQVKALGQRIGFGALMSTAEAGWRETIEAEGYSGAEHTSGPCRSTINSTLALIRAALAKQEDA